jgi:hypothetical protein
MQPERESSMKCFMRPLQCSSLRVETYNTFIIRSSNGVNNTATFANANSQDPTRNPQTQAICGQFSSTLNPRLMQLAVWLDF